MAAVTVAALPTPGNNLQEHSPPNSAAQDPKHQAKLPPAFKFRHIFCQDLVAIKWWMLKVLGGRIAKETLLLFPELFPKAQTQVSGVTVTGWWLLSTFLLSLAAHPSEACSYLCLQTKKTKRASSWILQGTSPVASKIWVRRGENRVFRCWCFALSLC